MPNLLMPDTIAYLRVLNRERTQGEWAQDAYYFVAEIPQGRPGGEVIGSAQPSASLLPGYPRVQWYDNAAFIVAAANNIIPALDALAAAEEREKRLTERLASGEVWYRCHDCGYLLHGGYIDNHGADYDCPECQGCVWEPHVVIAAAESDAPAHLWASLGPEERAILTSDAAHMLGHESEVADGN